MISTETLRRYPFFTGASAESLQALAMVSEERQYAAGERLFDDGQPADRMYIVVDGEVDIQYELAGDEYRTVDTRVGGDLLVWSAIVHPYRTTAFGVARRPTRVITIESRKLRELCEQDRELGYHLYREVAQVVSARLLGARVQLATVA